MGQTFRSTVGWRRSESKNHRRSITSKRKRTMSNRPPFLDLLTETAVLTGTILRNRITGPANIAKVIEATGQFYKSRSITFNERVKDCEIIMYEAVLINECELRAVVTLSSTPDGKISHVSVMHSPIESVIWLSKEMGNRLSGEFAGGTFLGT